MSYSYERVDRRRRTGGGYGASSRRTTFGYWVPLALTVTVATIGLAAWIWSEKNDDDEEISDNEHYPGGVPPPGYASMSGGIPVEGGSTPGYQGPPPAGAGGPPPPGFSGPPESGGDFARSTGVENQDESTLVARMSGALRRTPSPQQSYDWATKKVAAGVAAAGAMVGGALNSIREGPQEDYEDHERWSEEADNRDNQREPNKGIKRQGTADEFFEGKVEMPRQASISSKKRKTVAIVVSAVEHESDGLGELGQHASVLAHLPEHVDPDLVRVFVLIYAPDLKAHPLSVASSSTKPPSSLTSSYSNIAHEDAGPSSSGALDTVDPHPIDDTTPLFKTLYNQAQALVDKDTMILPFTTPNGHSHILRSLGPQTVYIQESLCGEDGEIVGNLSGWVKETVVVVGDEGGHGGLVDTDDEGGRGGESEEKRGEKWWMKEERTGLGKRVAVVDSLRVGEDWRRRVGGHD